VSEFLLHKAVHEYTTIASGREKSVKNTSVIECGLKRLKITIEASTGR
jgi:hypothetical protein